MKFVAVSFIIALIIGDVASKPTFDVIADVMHDLLYEEPHHGRPQYVDNGAYGAHNGYHQPGYTQGAYGYHKRPHQVATGNYPNNPPNGYYTNNHHGGYYPAAGIENYGSHPVYDNQGYYMGPPYANSNHQPHGYNYNNQHTGYHHY